MIVVKGDLFEQNVSAICITTNGYWTLRGEAVMGRGVAEQAAKKWPFIKKKLGYMLNLHGTHVYLLSKKRHVGNHKVPYHVVSFPVKPKMGISTGKNVVRNLRSKFPEGKQVPGYLLRANLKLIKRSAEELVELADARGWKTVALPKPGCGAGELKWEAVREVLKPILKGKRFIIVDYVGG